MWKRVAGDSKLEVPEPQEGIDEDFDRANQDVTDIKIQLEQYLDKIRNQFKERRIQFSHAKNRYEIEIPDELVKGGKKPKDFELVSTRQGFQRFYTPFIKETVELLEIAEDKLKDATAPFLTAIFKKFYD